MQYNIKNIIFFILTHIFNEVKKSNNTATAEFYHIILLQIKN